MKSGKTEMVYDIYNILAVAWKDCVSVWFSILFWAPCFILSKPEKNS